MNEEGETGETNPQKPKTRRNIIAISIAVTLIVSVYIVIYYILPTFPAPEFKITEPCLKAINLENKTLWNIILKNTGKGGGIAGLCVSSNTMLFEHIAKTPTNQLCLEKSIGADTNELFAFEVSPDQSIVKQLSKAQIDAEVRCYQEILYFFRIGCKGIDYSCIYRKGNVSFDVERAVYR